LWTSFKTLPFAKASIALAGAFYLYFAAVAVCSAQSTTGEIGWAKVLTLALAPICIFCALRYPIAFPFGLYVALVPFDALLAVSSTSSLVKFIGYAVFGALSLRMLRLRKLLVPHVAWYAWLAFVIYNALSTSWSADFDNGVKVFQTILQLFIMMTLLAIYPISRREFDIIATFAVAFGSVAALYCLKQFYGGHSSYELAPRLNLSTDNSTIDVNYLAGAFLVPLAFALGSIFYSKRPLVRLLSGLTLPLFMGAIFVTGSREVLLAAALIFAFLAVRSEHRVLAAVLGAVCVGSSAFFPSILTRLFEENLVNGSGRTDIWKAAMSTFPDHWLFGSGVASFQRMYDTGVLRVSMQEFPGWDRPGHSVIFESLNDYGVVGFAIVILCWYLTFRQMRVIPKTSSLYGYRIVCEAMIVGYAIQALLIDPTYIKYFWLAYSLPLMVLNLHNPRTIGFRIRLQPPHQPQPPALAWPGHAHPGG
jgi:uncharacterized membrane protein